MFIDTKNKILEVSLELFAKKGFDGVSVREIAKEVGVRESALYKHYKNKEDILDKIVEEMISSIRKGYELQHVPETLIVGVADGYRNISEEQLCEMSWNIFKMFTEESKLSNFRKLLMREQFHNKAFAKYYNSFFIEGVIESQAKTFLQLVDSGLFRKADERIISLHFYGPILLLFQQYDCEPEKKDEIKEMLFKHVKAFGEYYGNKEAQL